MLRGASRKNRGGSPAGLAQPFTPLLIKAAGRGDLKTVYQLETTGTAIKLHGKALFKGLYANELLVRTLPRFDPSPRLFAAYGDILPQLLMEEEQPLREFELALLDELGYELIFAHDADGDFIDPQLTYWYQPSSGFTRRVFQGVGFDSLSISDNPEGLRITGDTLLAIAKWRHGDHTLFEHEQLWLKRVIRLALAQHLGDKPLKSRELFKAFTQTDSKLSPTDACS